MAIPFSYVVSTLKRANIADVDIQSRSSAMFGMFIEEIRHSELQFVRAWLVYGCLE